MSYRFRKSNSRNKALQLSAKRKVNKGQNLAAWRKRQKELKELREAGLLSDVPLETPDIEQNLSIEQAATNVIIECDPVVRTPEGINIIEAVSSNPENGNSSQSILSSSAITDEDAQPVIGTDTENSNATQSVLNNDSYILPTVTIPNTSTSDVLDNIGSSQEAGSSVAVEDKCNVSKGDVESTQNNLNSSKTSDNDHSSNSCDQTIITPTVSIIADYIPPEDDSSTHRTVATQLNFGDVKIYKGCKRPYICVSKKTKTKNAKPFKKQYEIVVRRRIIDVYCFFRALKKMNKHSQLGCNLNNIIITNEKKRGICTCYYLKCTMCDFEKEIWSENLHKKDNLNNDFVRGMLNLNCSFEAMNELLTTLRLPSLHYDDYMWEYNKISKEKKKNMETCQSTSASDNLIEQVDFSRVLVKDQFAVEENTTEDENESETILPEQTMTASDNKLTGDQEQGGLNMAIIKQEIHSESEDEELAGSTSKEVETPNGESPVENDAQSNIMPNKQVWENRTTDNENLTNLEESAGTENIHDNNMLVEHKFKVMETTESEGDFDNFHGAELPAKKARMLMHKDNSLSVDKLNNSSGTQGIPTEAPNIENRFESDDLKGVSALSSCTTDSKNIYLMPTQDMSKSAGNNALVMPQIQNNVASGTMQGASGVVLMPETSSVLHQPTDQSSGGLFPLLAMHQSWTNNFTTPAAVNNPLIIIPGTSGTAYIPGAPIAIQQPTNLPNVALSTNGAAFVPLTPGLVQQFPNPPYTRPPLASPHSSTLQNTAGPRWIGRDNMNNDDPFCKLPGGAPEEVPDPIPPKSNSDQPSHDSKRPRFHCDDCDINFAKYESLVTHKKTYCIKRLKPLPSSTVTSHASTNNPINSACASPSSKMHTEDLLSAMATRRSLLENSMKTALDAQYIINLHKSAQDLTRKSFKELDNALIREKTLMPEASLEEQQAVSEARVQALMRAEAAYKQEKYSAAAVEQALYRQKTAIEATLSATGHEQTALISTLKGLKVQANQTDFSSMSELQHNKLCQETNFNQENTSDISLLQKKEQQKVADTQISTRSFPVNKTSFCSPDFSVEKRQEINVPLQTNVFQNISCFDQPESPNTINCKNKKEMTVKVLPENYPQPKEINPIVSYSRSNVEIAPNYENRFSFGNFHSQKYLNVDMTTSAETSLVSVYRKENMPHSYSRTQEICDDRLFSQSTQTTVNLIDKSFRQNIQSEEMMDTSAQYPNENT